MTMSSFLQSTTFRFVAIGILIGALMVLLLMVYLLLLDRENYHASAVDRVGQAWGLHQIVTGPALALQFHGEHAPRRYFLPEDVAIQLSSTHEFRKLGIFDIPVLASSMQLTGSFDLNAVDDLIDELGMGAVRSATLFLGVTDTRGIRSATLQVNDELMEFQSTRGSGAFTGIETMLRFEQLETTALNFQVDMELRFTRRMGVVLVGESSTLSASSTWPHPSFDGRFLPDSHSVRSDGFDAQWTSNALARGFGDAMDENLWRSLGWTINSAASISRPGGGNASAAPALSVGFSVYEPVTPYRLTLRAVKYGVMFVVFTLVSVLCIELFTNRRFHIVQYGIVGVALVFFFVLMLSLSELINFGLAYALAAFILTVMVGSYSWFIQKDVRITIAIQSIIVLLFAVMYVLLRLEEFALVAGSLLGLLLLVALMVATRSIQD